MPVILFLKIKRKTLILAIISILFLINYLYGNYTINNNKIQTKDHVKEKNFIYVKIISPNFELKYDLSEEETLARIKKLIRYSNIEKEKKLFIWPEGALSGKYFFEIKR